MLYSWLDWQRKMDRFLRWFVKFLWRGLLAILALALLVFLAAKLAQLIGFV